MAAEPAPRLLYLLSSFDGGGAEWGLIELLDGGALAGLQVVVAALARGQGAQLEALRARGYEPVLLTEAPRLTPLALARAARALHRLFRQEAWAAAVLSLPHANILGRLLCPRRRRPLLLSFEHNSRLSHPIYEALYRRTAGRVDWLLADCEATLRAAVAARFPRPPPRQDVLPLVRFPPGRFEGPLADPPVGAAFHLVSAGRLTATKNQAYLIDVVDELRRLGLDTRLTLYGEGPLRAALQTRAATLGLGDRVELPGRTPRWWERPAHAFVLSSLHEGLCIAALEALAAGLPVAATPVGALADYGPRAGVLTLGGDARADARALSGLLLDPERMAACGRLGRRYAQTHFECAAVDRLYSSFAARLLTTLGQSQT